MDNREHLIENALMCYEEDRDFEYYASNENNQYMAEQYGIKLEDVWIMACNVIYNWKPDWIYQGKEEKWISVKDRLPKEFEEVILYTSTKIFSKMVVGYRGECHGVSNWYACGRGNTFICDNTEHYSEKVTHWMPLPEPPKED